LKQFVLEAPLATIQTLYIPAQEVIERSNSNIELIGPIHEAETNQLFLDEKT